MPTDQELRDRALKRVYDLRHEKGWQKLPDALNMPDVPEQTLGNIIGQLRDKGLVKWHRTMGGHCRGAIEITAAGVDEIESQSVVIPPVEIAAGRALVAHPTHTLVSWFAFVAGIAFGLLGVVLVWLGATGATNFKVMGFDLSTGSVGIAAIALGAVLILFTLRRVLVSVERLQA